MHKRIWLDEMYLWGLHNVFKSANNSPIGLTRMIESILRAERNKLPMKCSQIQQVLNGRYGAQANLVGLFYLPDVLIGRTLYWLQLLFHLQCLPSLDVSFLLKSLDHLRQLAFFLLSLRQGLFHLFELSQQGFPSCR